MRFYEISSGLRIPVSQEEQDIIDLIAEKGKIKKSMLDERQQEVSRLMVSRGLLIRERTDKVVYLRLNSASDIWRL